MTVKENKTVSYIAFEGEMTRLERINTRLIVVCLLLLFLLIASNALWLLKVIG